MHRDMQTTNNKYWLQFVSWRFWLLTAVSDGILALIWWGLGKLFTIGSIIQSIGLLFLLIAGVFAVAWYLPKITSIMINKRSLTSEQIVKKEEAIKPLEDMIKEAKVVWGMWHSGDTVRGDKLFDVGTIKRTLLAEPTEDNCDLRTGVAIANEDLKTIISQIKNATKGAVKTSKVRWHRECRQVSITICDTNPSSENGEFIPDQPSAYIVAQVLEPKVSRKMRHLYIIKNEGRDAERFRAFLNDFKDIWDNKSREPKKEEYS